MLKTTKSKLVFAILMMFLTPFIARSGNNALNPDGLYQLEPINKTNESEKKFLYKKRGLNIYLLSDQISYVTKEKIDDIVKGSRIDLIHKNTSNQRKFYGKVSPLNKGNIVINLKNEMYRLIKVDSVIYENLYDNINLKYFLSPSGDLTYHYFLEKGANVRDIKVEYIGAEKLTLSNDGSLVISNNTGTIHETQPVSFKDNQIAVSSNFDLQGNTLNYTLDNFSPNSNYVIDPVISYSTYLGGSGSDFGNHLAIDDSSNIYGVGTTLSNNFPTTTGAYQTTADALEDAVIFKMDSLGVLEWATYYGGNNQDEGKAIGVSPTGNVYVTGYSKSFNLPGIAANNPGDLSIFVLKFNNNGTLALAKFFGGNGTDETNALLVYGDSVFLTGVTSSSNFPKAGLGVSTSYGSGRDAFLTIMNTNLNAVYSGYYGGGSSDIGNAICIDRNDNIVIAGETESTDLPTILANQTTKSSVDDGFIARFTRAGVLTYSTYYGGNGLDNITGVTCDTANNMYVIGNTRSTDLFQPTTGVTFQNTNKGSQDIFITKFNELGVPQWGTYYGDTSLDVGASLAISEAGGIIATGYTSSAKFPIDSVNAEQLTKGFGTDAYLLQFDNNGNREYATFLGGNGNDFGSTALYEPNQSTFILYGNTRSSDFKVSPIAFQPAIAGIDDIFIYTSCSLIPNNTISSAGVDTLRYCDNDPAINIEGTTPIGGSGNYTYKFQISNDSTSGFQDIPNSNVKDLPISLVNPIYGLNSIRRIVTDGVCSDTSNVTVVNFLAAPIVNFSFDTLCFGDSIQFTDLTVLQGGIDSIRTWRYEFGDGQISILQNPKLSFDTTGIIRAGLIVTASNGCFDGFITNIQVNDRPAANFTFTNQCGDKAVQFTNTSTNETVEEYEWNFGDGSTSNLENPTHTYANYGKYDVSFVIGSSLGCSDTIVLPVGVDSSITADFTTSNNTCLDSVVTFIETSQLNGSIATWNWNFGDGTTSTDTMPTKLYTTGGNHSITLIVTSVSGCTDTVTKTIFIGQPGTADFNFNRTCVGVPTQFTDESTASVGTISNWFWDFGDGFTSTQQNPAHTYDTAGTFMVTLVSSTAEGCSNSSTKTIVINDGIDVSAGPDLFIFEGSSVQLNAESSVSNLLYNWTPVQTLNSPNIKNPTARPLVTTEYTIRIVDTAGCVGEDKVIVNVSPEFFIPTLFTPNGDGENDVFEIEGINVYPNHSVHIFNRWGSELYSAKGNYFANPWDGTYEGEKLPIGAYYYIIDLGDGSKLYKGTISILK